MSQENISKKEKAIRKAGKEIVQNIIQEVTQEIQQEDAREVVAQIFAKADSLPGLQELNEQETKAQRKTRFMMTKFIYKAEFFIDAVFSGTAEMGLLNIKIVDIYFNEINKKDCVEYYKDFIENYIYDKIENKVLAEYLVKNTLKNLNKKEIAFEDLAPIMYIHYKIYGTKVKKNLRHVIIDEAQDYGEFQFSILKTILKSNSMTILGDIAQGVHSYRGIENWKKFIEVEFPEGNAIYTTLEKTYRTTKEIMQKANEVIDKLPEFEKQFIIKGKPVIDGKDSIHITKLNSEDEIIKHCSEKIDEYLKQGFKSIAIIGKDIDECKTIKKKIQKYNKDIKLIQSKDSEYNAGISIVPSYLAKGLEFDSVILFNVNNEKYKKDILDIKLLYVAITRAMSKLDIFYINNMSELLN